MSLSGENKLTRPGKGQQTSARIAIRRQSQTTKESMYIRRQRDVSLREGTSFRYTRSKSTAERRTRAQTCQRKPVPNKRITVREA